MMAHDDGDGDDRQEGEQRAAPAEVAEATAAQEPRRARRGRRWLKVALVLLLVGAPLAAAAGVQGYRYTETNPQFCVTCHLMEEPAAKWKESSHADVSCQTCHRATFFDKLRLGWAGYIERPDEIPPHTKMDHGICAECHVSDDDRWLQIAETPGHASHTIEKGISCLDCHSVEPHVFEAETGQCLQCHGEDKLEMTKMDELHCMGCHDFAGRRGATLLPTALDCSQCHPPHAKPDAELPESLARLGVGMGKPAPVDEGHGDCLTCHRPHGRPLDDPMDCLSCHRDLLNPRHEHYRDERLGESCLECHPPHDRW